MGENGKQARERVVSTIEVYLRNSEDLPIHNGHINVKRLAINSGVNRKNFYDVEEVIKLVNRKAGEQGVPLLLLPNERALIAENNSGNGQLGAKPEDVKALERIITRLENRIAGLDNQVKEMKSKNNKLESNNKKLESEVYRLKRLQYLDDMALEGRPVRDKVRFQ